MRLRLRVSPGVCVFILETNVTTLAYCRPNKYNYEINKTKNSDTDERYNSVPVPRSVST